VIELLQFRHSPYNEKVRWALDLKRVAHIRRSLLPGPHMGIVKPLTGRTTTPVIRHEGSVIDGSARLIEWLDDRWPEPRLLPTDPAQRDEALRIQRWFDDEITPRIRRTVLDALLASPEYFARVFAEGRPRWQQLAYACAVPLAAPLIRKGNGIAGAASIEDGHAAAGEAMDFVASRCAGSGYLVGAVFTVADLTAASTLAVLARPERSPMSAPEPVHPGFAALIARYAAHPAIVWTRAIYAKHRLADTDFDGIRNA
jgi:glutathione S-transferase